LADKLRAAEDACHAVLTLKNHDRVRVCRPKKNGREEYATNVQRFSSQAWMGADVVEEFLRRANMIE